MAVWTFKNLTQEAQPPQIGFEYAAQVQPSAYTFGDSEHVQYVRPVDSHIIELWWDHNNPLWQGRDLTDVASAPSGVAGGTLTAGYAFGDSQHVFYNGNAQIDELYWDPTHDWLHNQPGAGTGAPQAGSAPSVYVFGNSQHVFYTALGDAHIHEVWWDTNGWHHAPGDLNLAAEPTGGALSAYSAPSAYLWGNTQHVVYLGFQAGPTGTVNELWWDTNGWHYDPGDLTAAAQAPPAGGTSVSGYVFGTQHVVYKGADEPHHIHELWFDTNALQWMHNDLTKGAIEGAPENVASDPFAFVAGGTQRVVYTGTDSHIHELWWDTAGWHYYPGDLTHDANGGPAAHTRPTGYDYGGPHVVYVGSDVPETPGGDVIELYRQ